ncbi:asparaginase [Aquimarina sp. ERC-38]|uniref:asparaginase n=1 Tax=Aquimarina sp. ERC-38 TaxID=2949996 RepID=UPI0022462190|nr:asparaginase [Aquimarina sp. ERC-38]UZO81270.1 asparaginase [Aquimarina sp. ERC-38]
MNPNIPNILLIYTGGTIGMIKDFESGALKAFNFKKLLKHIPELKLLHCHIETISFEEPIDSSDMNPLLWAQLGNIIHDHYHDFDGFVVLHGSDTMSYTASALSFMFENLQKPVICTGSQLPIGDLRTDAKENVITAIQLAALQYQEKPVIKEVGLYFEYKLLRGNRTSKMNAAHFEAFRSYNYPPLAVSGVKLVVNHKDLLKPDLNKKLFYKDQFCTEVIIIRLFPGISKEITTEMMLHSKVRGVIIETFGAGNALTAEWFVTVLKELKEREIPVINCTQCKMGEVNMKAYETGKHLLQYGVISGKDITIESAIVKLMFLLSQNLSYKQFKTKYEKSLRGEML